MTEAHRGEALDWTTYNALVQVIKHQRQEYIDERENEFTEDARKYELLLLQMAMTDLRAKMCDLMLADMESDRKQKDS